MTAAYLDSDDEMQWQVELWNNLRTQFLAFQDTLEEIIYKKAWMGHASFFEAWASKMSDITLAAELRPHVVYQMLAEGLSVEDIAANVKGVGVDRVESLKRQKTNGVPARDASRATSRKWHNKADDGTTIVREHERGPKSEAGSLHLELGPLKLKVVTREARKLGISAQEFGIAALDLMLEQVRGA